MIKTAIRTEAELIEEKRQLLADSIYPEPELLHRGNNWESMDDKHWAIFERLESLNWLIADDPQAA